MYESLDIKLRADGLLEVLGDWSNCVEAYIMGSIWLYQEGSVIDSDECGQSVKGGRIKSY